MAPLKYPIFYLLNRFIIGYNNSKSFFNTLGKRLCPRFRGERAGKLVKAREANQRYEILQVQSRRPFNRKIQFEVFHRRHNPASCVCISPNASVSLRSERQDKQFVPSLFLSNVMSLAPKIDEVCHVIQNADFDLVCITETWLQNHILDTVVALEGYNLIRRDRKETIHCGVCMYVKDSIPFRRT